MQGELDVALMRREMRTAGLDFRFLVMELLIAILPVRHRLARHKTVRPEDICREDFISTAGDRLRIDEVVLVRLHKGLHEPGWDQPHIVTLLPQCPSQKVRS
jgi:DNA-binding transcriptional LysR family regulator